MRKNFTLFVLFVLLATVKTNTTHAQVNVQDSLALVQFYDSTGGPNWIRHDNWLTTQPVTTWYGIEVVNKKYINVTLPSNNLTKVIPFDAIRYLNKLLVNHNHITQIAALPKDSNRFTVQLFTLDVSYNNLTGTIPYYITKLRSLGSLNLSHNKLSGQIPAFDDQFNVGLLDLSNNLLTGHIPESIGNDQNLATLNLSNNEISGTIPLSITNIVELSSLVLYNNKITGSIIAELGKAQLLKFLYLNNNKLTGSIPSSLGRLNLLRDIDISENNLSGNIPDSLGMLIRLDQLNLNDNNLSGSIPSSFNRLLNIDTLRLQHNHLSGTVPNLGNLARIRDLSLYSNNFTFNGLEAIQQEYGSKTLYYIQALIPIHQHGNMLAVSAGGTLGYNTYTWSKDGIVIETNTSDSILIIDENGTYSVTVNDKLAPQLTLRSDTYTVSGFNKPATSIALYPNPAKSNATALFNATGNYSLILSNASGKVLQTITGTSNKVQNKVDFNISSYSSGMYFISIKDEKETRLLKLTKE